VSSRAGIAMVVPIRDWGRVTIWWMLTYPARQETGPPGSSHPTKPPRIRLYNSLIPHQRTKHLPRPRL